MKIPRLFTPEQFKDYLKEKLPLKEGSINMIKAGRWDLMNSFLEYQKQPLKKEMFVNELEYPDKANYDFTDKNVTYNGKGYPERCYDHDLKAWQEAEKKVIFKGEFIHDDEFGIMIKESDGEYALLIDEDCFLYKRPISAIANMKLELQNVEL